MKGQVNEQQELNADLFNKYEYHPNFCDCGKELSTEQEQDRGICKDCI